MEAVEVQLGLRSLIGRYPLLFHVTPTSVAAAVASSNGSAATKKKGSKAVPPTTLATIPIVATNGPSWAHRLVAFAYSPLVCSNTHNHSSLLR
jgi:hypothetical protein